MSSGKEQLDDDVNTLIDHAEQRVLAVRESTGKQEGLKSLSSHVAEAIERIQYMLIWASCAVCPPATANWTV